MPEGQPGNVIDPYRAYNYSLNLGGKGDSFFTECSGLGVKVEAIPYREGGAGHVTRYVPGRVQYEPVILRYGVTDSQVLWEWLVASVEGRVERENISILMLHSEGTPGFQWNLIRAWPSAWQAAPLDALSQEVAIESLTLSYEELQRVPG